MPENIIAPAASVFFCHFLSLRGRITIWITPTSFSSNLEKIFRNAIESSKQMSNIELYEFTLRNQFKPSHMNQLLREWKSAKKIQVLDSEGVVKENARGFGLTYDEYKSKRATYYFKKR